MPEDTLHLAKVRHHLACANHAKQGIIKPMKLRPLDQSAIKLVGSASTRLSERLALNVHLGQSAPFKAWPLVFYVLLAMSLRRKDVEVVKHALLESIR